MSLNIAVKTRRLAVALLAWFFCAASARATQETNPLPPYREFHKTPEVPGLDSNPAVASGAGVAGPKQAGPIAPAGAQPKGPLTGRIIFTSGGHGWAWTGSAWALGRPLLCSMVEDYGNIDQMTMFAFYCFNAGATVVPMRPVGHQTNEVVLDNVSPAVTWSGAWADSSSSIYYGAAGSTPYRFATVEATETATATYTPAIPMAGFYPVYTWVLNGGNRTNQLYRINHTGGQSLVRVPHHMVGNGWVYLGTYYFNAGSNALSGSVLISNLGEGTPGASVVIADAIRFGNGMGNVDRGGGVSTYPREEECARYWVQRSLGQGQSSSIYDVSGLIDSDDNVGVPIRMAVEMNRNGEGNMYKRLYVGFHSNATTGNTNTATARGVTALYNDPSISTNVAPNSNTPNQYRLAQLLGTEINTKMTGISAPPLEVAWYSRGTSITYANPSFAYGEINNNTINNEFDATIVEVAFHDNVQDAALMRDPKARNWVARAAYQGVLRYMNQFDAAPLVFLPEPPTQVRAQASSNAILVSWLPPIAQGGSGAATNYFVYRSVDGYGFGDPVPVPSSSTSCIFTNLPPDTDYYFRVSAANGGGESFPSETVGCRRASNPLSTRVLFVNGFTRFDRTLNLRQTPGVELYKPPGHDGNSGTMERVMPQRINSFDYVVPHGKAIAAATSMGFDTCQVQTVTNGIISLLNYGIVVWACGNQSTADRTFNAAAQQRISAFLAAGGNLFVSGSEIAWDLDRDSGPSGADRNFLHNQLHAALNGNTNDDSGVYSFAPTAGSLFAGNATGIFDDGSKGIYWVGSPDALTPTGDALSALSYPGYAGGAAAVSHPGSGSGGKVVFLGFPFETMTAETLRTAYLGDVLRFFSRPVRFDSASLLADNRPRFTLSGEPGLTYTIQSSTNFTHWATVTNIPNPNGTFEFVDAPVATGQKFFRAVLGL